MAAAFSYGWHVVVDKGLLSVWFTFEPKHQLRLSAMGSKHSLGLPPTSAAPIYPDSSSAVGEASPSHGDAINRQVKRGDLSCTARRQLAERKPLHSADVCETTSIKVTSVLATSDRIVRLPELLAIFQISRTTVYEWQKAGRLPRSVALGPRTRGWKLSDITRFLASLGTEASDD